MPKHPLSEQTKSDFHEMARRIVAADRAARKHGRSQDTVSAIRRAMESAFRLGQIQRDAEEMPKPLRWEDLPPRARQALHYLGFVANLNADRSSRGGVALDVAGGVRRKWRVIGTATPDLAFAEGTIMALHSKGLLEYDESSDTVLKISDAGLALYAEYLRRREAGDRTLPLEGMNR
jgi:hypothetical protein